MDRADDIGLRQHQQIVVAFQVVRVRRELGPAIVGFTELVALDHRTHRAVEDQDALLEQGGELGSTVGLHVRVAEQRVGYEILAPALLRTGVRSTGKSSRDVITSPARGHNEAAARMIDLRS